MSFLTARLYALEMTSPVAPLEFTNLQGTMKNGDSGNEDTPARLTVGMIKKVPARTLSSCMGTLRRKVSQLQPLRAMTLLM